METMKKNDCQSPEIQEFVMASKESGTGTVSSFNWQIKQYN